MRIYNFDDLYGNRKVISLLKHSLKRGGFSNVTILNGVHGTGKSSSAEISALDLTCDRPVDGNPCLQCQSCKSNLEGIKKNGQGVSVVKKNIAMIQSKKDIDDLIKEVFILESPLGNIVYILEEFHSLNFGQQTTFLEEIDRLPNNVYIIICTTKINSIIKELQSRALTLTFNRLTKSEMNMLYDNIVDKLNYEINNNKKMKEFIVNLSQGVPRELVNMVDYVGKNGFSASEVSGAFGYIDYKDLTQLMYLGQTGVKEMLEHLSALPSSSPEQILTRLREYMVDVSVLLLGGYVDIIDKDNRKRVKEIFTSKGTALKICKQLEKYKPREVTETDIKMLILDIYQILNGKTRKEITTEGIKMASSQRVRAEETANMVKSVDMLSDDDNPNLAKLDLGSFISLSKNNKGGEE